MNNTIEYKGYLGSVEFSEPDGVFFGKVQGVGSVISYEGTTASELIEDFHGAVDDYLQACEEEGSVPEKPYSGILSVHIGSDLHKRAAVCAMAQQQSLESFIKDAVRDKLLAASL